MSEPTNEFRACVKLALGPDNVLYAQACFAGQCWERQFDLNPMIAYVQAAIAEYHRRLHGDVMFSGLDDFLGDAINAVSSVMSDKAVRQLWSDAAPIADLIPGGAAVDLAFKAHDVLVKAKDGDKKSTDKLQQLAGMSLADPTAADTLMLVGKLNDLLNEKQQQDSSSASQRGKAFKVTHISGYRIGDVTVRDHRTPGGSGGGSLPSNVVNAPGTGYHTPSPIPAPAPQPDPSQQYGGYGGYPPPGYPPPGYPPPGYPSPYGMGSPPMPGMDPYSMMMQQQMMQQAMMQQAMMQQAMMNPYGAYGDPTQGYIPTAGGMPTDYSHIPGHVPGDDYASAQNPYGYQFSGWGYNRPYRAAGGWGKGLRDLYNTGLNN